MSEVPVELKYLSSHEWVLVENNVVHDAVSGGWGSNFNCFGNVVQNNIFAYGKRYQLTVYGDQPSEAIRAKGNPWMIKPADFFSTVETARDLFARIINCESDCIAVIPQD